VSNHTAAADLDASTPQLEIIRSARRRRTVSAYRDGDRTIVRLPAGLSAEEEQRWIAAMLTRLASRDSRRRPSDPALVRRAESLRERHLPEAKPPTSVRWVGNQHGRWGSCTIGERTIRISDRLTTMPGWVLDYVLVHELAHLLVADHDADFWRLVDRYPQASRARGFLEGYATAAARGPDGAGPSISDAD
jgi:predicted metal-dependent hydrolase